MCIRDRIHPTQHPGYVLGVRIVARIGRLVGLPKADEVRGCLLYTSDAADERSSVDLGGRRIIKKKNKAHQYAGMRHGSVYRVAQREPHLTTCDTRGLALRQSRH